MYSLLVPAAQVATLVLPPLALLLFLPRKREVPELLLTALLCGVGAQAAIGFVWNHAVARAPHGAGAVYYAGWLLAGLAAAGCARRRRTRTPAAPAPRHLLLWGLLLFAYVVRVLHPLQTAALGQSDAYSHLLFLQQILADGHLHNRLYPAGYSWVMVLPSLTFGLDPYWVARFGGGFWAMALILAVYDLARYRAGRTAGLLAAALVACCPLWLPLIKTGVGAFANQAGLVLLPALLLALLQKNNRLAAPACFLLPALLSITVPMMFIALLPVLAVYGVLTAGISQASGRFRFVGTLLLALLPALFLLYWQTARIQGIHREATVTIVTDGDPVVARAVEQAAAVPTEGNTPAANPESRANVPAWWLLVRHYLAVKRAGYGHPALNAAGLLLGGCFLFVLAAGCWRRREDWGLLGAWGMISSLQAAFGVLQFAGYQREGWSLLLAVAWLGGVIGDAGFEWRGRPRALRMACGIFFAACYGVMLWHPPSHAPGFSAAEDDLVRVVHARAVYVAETGSEPPLTIVLRPFSGFHGDQGNIMRAVTGYRPKVDVVTVGPDLRWKPDPSRQYLFVMDLFPLDATWSPGLFGHIAPDQAEHFLRAHHRMFEWNEAVRRLAASMPEQKWKRTQPVLSPGLEVVHLLPVEQEKGSL